jgi:hypothetical protein
MRNRKGTSAINAHVTARASRRLSGDGDARLAAIIAFVMLAFY